MPSQKLPAIAVILIAIGFLALSGLRSIGAGEVGVQFFKMSGESYLKNWMRVAD